MKISYIQTLYYKYLPLITGILFVFLLLTNPVNSSILVNSGLTTWYKHMIPSLFPFMVLSGFLLRTGISRQLSNMLYPILGKLFQLSPDCVYIIIMGFLCGFPMGASIISDSFILQKISRREANLLLAFCNNIGPIYFISFVTVACPYYPLWITLPIMYVVPFIYGLILRYSVYKDIPKYVIYTNTTQKHNQHTNYLHSFEESTQKALVSIITLGGYMIIFNVLQLPLYNTFFQLPENILYIFRGLIEINSGIAVITKYPQLYIIAYTLFLPFGGLCCIFQTYAMIKDTPLSLRFYLLHKMMQTFVTVFIYIAFIIIGSF